MGLLVKALTSYGHPILQPLQKSHSVSSCAMIFFATSEAKSSFKKALKLAPGHSEAILGLAQIARTEGHFDEAESLIKRALKVHPKMPGAWRL